MIDPKSEVGSRIALRKGRMGAEAVVYALITIWALIMAVFPAHFHAESHIRGRFYATLIESMPPPSRRIAFALLAFWASTKCKFAYSARTYDDIELNINDMVQMFDWKGTRHSVPNHTIENVSSRSADLSVRAGGHRYSLPYRFLQISLADRRAIRSSIETIAHENVKEQDVRRGLPT